jgi:hypothetical protein
MKTERIFQILIVIFAAAAVYFWTAGNKDGVFVCFVLASVSFFISVRFQAKGRMKQKDLELKKEEKV